MMKDRKPPKLTISHREVVIGNRKRQVIIIDKESNSKSNKKSVKFINASSISRPVKGSRSSCGGCSRKRRG